MAIVYYPTSTTVNQRTVSGSAYTELDLSVVPNTIFFFNTSSQLDYVSASIFPYTTSYAISASFAVNAAGGTTLLTGGFYPITSSQTLTASWAVTASHGINASYAATADTASYSTSGSAAILSRTASYVSAVVSSSWSSASFSSSYSRESDLANVSISSSWATQSLSSSWALNSFSSSYAISSSWADNSVSTSYISSASYGVSSSWASASFTASHALTSSYFDSVNNATGLLVQFYDTSSIETNTSLANTAGTYKASTSRITVNSPISLVSMSLQVAVSGTYHVYYSTNSSSYDNIGWIAISYSFTNATTSYSFLLEPTKYWWNDTIFVTLQRVDNASVTWRRGNGSYVGTYWSSNYSSFTGSGGLVDGVYGFPGSLTFYGYRGLYEYGNSLTTSSYSNTSVAAISSSWASRSYEASKILIPVQAGLLTTQSSTQTVDDSWGIATIQGAGIQLGAGFNTYIDGDTYFNVSGDSNSVVVVPSGSFYASGSLWGTSSWAVNARSSSYSSTSSLLNHTLTVAEGGTGFTSLASGYIPIGKDASSMTSSTHLQYQETPGILVGITIGDTTDYPKMSIVTAKGIADSQAWLLSFRTSGSSPADVAQIGYTTLGNAMKFQNLVGGGFLFEGSTVTASLVSSSLLGTASFADTSSWSNYSVKNISSSWASSSLSSSYLNGVHYADESGNIQTYLINNVWSARLIVDGGPEMWQFTGIPVSASRFVSTGPNPTVPVGFLGTASWAVNAQTASSLIRDVVRITNNYTIPQSKELTVVCLNTASITVTLPTASVVGTLLNIKNGTSGSWNITVSGSEKIDNQINVIINSAYSSMQLQSDGYQWWII